MYFSKYENMIIQEYVKVGERGQITIPKAIREKELIRSNEILKIIDIPGAIIIEKISTKSPEDVILDVLREAKLTDEDWEEIHKEREME